MHVIFKIRQEQKASPSCTHCVGADTQAHGMGEGLGGWYTASLKCKHLATSSELIST